MADGGTPASRSERSLPTGWPRPTAALERSIERRTGLDSKRQWTLVGLAVAGLGVGYVLGLLTAPTPPAAPVAEVASRPTAKAPAIAPPFDAPETGGSDPIASKLRAIMPHIADAAGPAGETPGTRPLAYEEALPRDVAVHVPPAAPSPRAAPRENVSSVPGAPTAVSPPAGSLESAPAAWQRHALAVAPIGDEPVVVVVMDDLGVDRRRTARTLEVAGPLTLAFMTYARDVQAQADRGRAQGHEIMMHVPMEPASLDVDPGPNVLLSAMPEKELTSALDWALSQFSGYTGINNHMGSRFTEDPEAVRVVMRELKRRGLLFLDSLTSRNSHAAEEAAAAGVPYAVRNVFIDHTDDRTAIRRQLATTARIAKETGSAIAIGHPRDNTIAELEPWLAGLKEQGIRLVPLSALIAKQMEKTPPPTRIVAPNRPGKSAPAEVAVPVPDGSS